MREIGFVAGCSMRVLIAALHGTDKQQHAAARGKRYFRAKMKRYQPIALARNFSAANGKTFEYLASGK